jgi:MerR family redox-sensitive transcriptional activator SoxR
MSEISIGAFSHRTGLPVSTSRFYDDNGLIQLNRNGGGHRRFERAQIRRVSFVIAAQKFGYTLPQIKELLDSLPNERTPTAEDWEQLSEKKVLMRKSKNCKNCVTHYQTALGAGVYL